MSQAAQPSDDPTELRDHVFDSLTSNIMECEYIDIFDNENSFTNEIDSLILLHLNIRTLNKYFNDLHNLIATLPFKLDVVCLSESRIDEPFKIIKIDGCNFVHVKPKTKGQAGGVAVCINVRIEFRKIDCFNLCGSESLWLKLQLQERTKSVIIGTIYRHPSENINKFVEDFADCLDKLTENNNTFYILGDININTQNKSFAEKYLNVITSNGAVPVSVITKPTRVTAKTATVIDHIITNDTSHKIIPRVIYSSITDHFLIACKVRQLNLFSRKMNTFFYRDKKFCSKTYCEEMYSKLANIVLSNFSFQRDKFNDVFEMFVTAISDTTEKHAPLTRLSRKQARLAKKPWITQGIFTSVKKKDSMFRSDFINGNLMKKDFSANIQTFSLNLRPCQRKLTFVWKSTKTITHTKSGILFDQCCQTS